MWYNGGDFDHPIKDIWGANTKKKKEEAEEVEEEERTSFMENPVNDNFCSKTFFINLVARNILKKIPIERRRKVQLP